jgi:ATP-dependent DNA helicase RecG
MTTYGDLDVSTIDQRPPGRIPIRTYHVPENQALEAVLKAVQKKQQAFIVYPLVEESEFLDVKAVHQEAQRLAQGIFSRFKVGTLTGPMKSTEKDKIMTAFRDGEIDILIASSIVEVGIDVPNATHMVIQHAERFGLATLHQLRGRIGRGPLPSTCYLVANAKSTEAKARIQILTETDDGFKLSEEDLRLRGPGEVLGVHQHGLPLLKLLNLSHDQLIIQSARNHAEQLLSKDPDLQNTDHQNLRRAIKENYDSKWQLGLSG